MAGLILPVIYAIYLAIVYFFSDQYPGGAVIRLYETVMILIAVHYIVGENRKYQYVYPPQDFGFLLLYFFPLYVPYYFVKSRGIRGLAIFVGFLVLLFLEWPFAWLWNALNPDAS